MSGRYKRGSSVRGAYRTVVTGSGTRIGGECSCPAFADFGFCKHMAAVALAANEPEAAGGEAKGALDRIRGHLAARKVDELVALIVELAKRDPVLLRREIGGGYGAFIKAAAVYAEALGEAGIAEYRRLATEARDARPSRGYSDRGARFLPGGGR